MKKFRYLLGGLLIFSFFMSCEKELMDNHLQDFSTSNLKSSRYNINLSTNSTPVSDNGVTPQIIPGSNPGGNRTCEEVALAFGKPNNYFLCSNRINYVNNSWDDDFPDGLDVEVNGIYISFNIEGGSLEIGDKFYKVGAVIVKGSNAANVYYYPDGIIGDGGLAAPGNRPMVSNITFCLIECDPIIVAVKSWCWYGDYSWSTSDGEYPFVTTKWCQYLGYNELTGNSVSFPLIFSYTDITVANVTITKGMSGYEVNVQGVQGCTLDITHVYIGSLGDLLETNLSEGCPSYTVAPWVSYNVDGNTQTFVIPY